MKENRQYRRVIRPLNIKFCISHENIIKNTSSYHDRLLESLTDKGEAIAPPVIEDINVLPEITAALKAHGYLIHP